MKENGHKIMLHTVRKIVEANLTIKRPISVRVLTYLSDYFTTQCAELTREAEKELSKENELRKLQGLQPKKRLTEDVFRGVAERRNQDAKTI